MNDRLRHAQKERRDRCTRELAALGVKYQDRSTKRKIIKALQGHSLFYRHKPVTLPVITIPMVTE